MSRSRSARCERELGAAATKRGVDEPRQVLAERQLDVARGRRRDRQRGQDRDERDERERAAAQQDQQRRPQDGERAETCGEQRGELRVGQSAAPTGASPPGDLVAVRSIPTSEQRTDPRRPAPECVDLLEPDETAAIQLAAQGGVQQSAHRRCSLRVRASWRPIN